jgi:hypothetical protein
VYSRCTFAISGVITLFAYDCASIGVPARSPANPELEALLKEVQETNQKLLDLMDARERQNGSGSA